MAEFATNIISTAAECNIARFMQCTYEQKYRVLLKEGDAPDDQLQAAAEYIYAQYVDFSGLYLTREFEMCAYINFLDTRNQTIKRFLELQKISLLHFDAPFVPAFETIKKYGHKLWWNAESPDLELFKRKLSQVESKEAKYKTKVEEKVKELIAFRARQHNKQFTLLESRKNFISMLNRLQQSRFVINKNETTVEELGLMIKDQRDEVETNKAMQKIKR